MESKRKILIVIQNLGIGGAQRMVLELVRKLDTARFDFRVICCSEAKGTHMEKTLETICPVEYLNIRGRVNIRALARAFRAFDIYKPDLIHAHLGGAAFAIPWCTIRRKPFLLTVHSEPNPHSKKGWESMLRRTVKRGKAFIAAVSLENYKLCKKHYGADDYHCTCINNGIDCDQYYAKDHSDFTFINVATHNKNKNQAMILDCFARLYREHSGIRLILAGHGPTTEELKVQADQLHISEAVDFVGNVSNVADYLSVSNVFLLSSYSEALPLAVLEGMATGLPVVSTHVGGMADIVKENGYLVPAGDENAFFEAMLKLLRMEPHDYSLMKAASLKTAQLYSSTTMANQYMELYDKIEKAKRFT